jgi:hypothetical protein
MSAIGEVDLSGRWSGVYFYPVHPEMNPLDDAPPTPFECVLLDSGGQITGTTSELDMFEPEMPSIEATLEGHNLGGQLTFTKTPDPLRQTHTIDYLGTISGDGNVIDGRWIIYGTWEGTFRMERRTTPQSVSADRFATVQD